MPGQKIWDFWAKGYESLWVQKYSLGPTRRAILQVMERTIVSEAPLSVLDMGCGTGQMLREMKQKWPGIRTLGVDAASQMIEIACGKSELIEYQVDSIDDFQASAASFDLIICAHSFPYYPNQARAIEKFAHLLKKPGVLLLAQASANSFYDKVALGLVKLTTSPSTYPSIGKVLEMTRPFFPKIETVLIKEKPYMPTIGLFICQK